MTKGTLPAIDAFWPIFVLNACHTTFSFLRRKAMSAMSDGNLDEAIKLFGEAMEFNPQQAVLYAKRAQILVNSAMTYEFL